MTTLDYIVLGWYGVANIIAFVLMGADKWKARRGSWRVPEKRLMLWCVAFGALGGLLGMRVFRHKTQHRRFAFGVPALMLLQVALFVLYFSYWR